MHLYRGHSMPRIPARMVASKRALISRGAEKHDHGDMGNASLEPASLKCHCGGEFGVSAR